MVLHRHLWARAVAFPWRTRSLAGQLRPVLWKEGETLSGRTCSVPTAAPWWRRDVPCHVLYLVGRGHTSWEDSTRVRPVVSAPSLCVPETAAGPRIPRPRANPAQRAPGTGRRPWEASVVRNAGWLFRLESRKNADLVFE